MKSLVKPSRLLLFVIVLIQSAVFGQFPKRMYKNVMSQHQYSTIENIHARALLVDSSQLIIGTNEGLLFSYDQALDSAVQWEQSSYKEIRDLAILGRQIVAMSSGDTSALIFYGRQSRKIEKVIPFYDVFLDGMDTHEQTLFLMGDPIDGQFSLYTYDQTEGLLKVNNAPKSDTAEAAFAASGSTVHYTPNGDKVFVTGGSKSRVFIQRKGQENWTETFLPIGNNPTSGIYSMVIDSNLWIAVGGNYLKPDEQFETGYYSKDFGKTWKPCKKGLGGYRSSIVKHHNQFYSSGRNGIDISVNGKKWHHATWVPAFAMIPFGDLMVYSGKNGVIYTSFKLTK